MKNEKFYDGITEIRDETIRRAESVKFHTAAKRIKRYGALAAALVLILGLSFFGYLVLRPAGSSAPGNSTAASGMSGGFSGSTGGTDSGESGVFQSYAGPVMTLTALEASPDMEVTRNTVFDFSLYGPHPVTDTDGRQETRSETATAVTDSYTLKNTGETEKTLTLLYPFVAAFSDSPELSPDITVDGEKTETELLAGSYPGTFFDSHGKPSETERLNLLEPTSWDTYRKLLTGGEYLADARRPLPELTQEVTVYLFTDFSAPEKNDDIPNPTLQVSYAQDYGMTTVLTYGFNGSDIDPENGIGARMVGGLDREQTEKAYLIVIGNDIQHVSLQGYKNLGCHKGEEIQVSCRMEKITVSLESILREIAEVSFSGWDNQAPLLSGEAGFSLQYRAFVENLLQYGLLSSDPIERYQDGRLEECMLDARDVRRVFWVKLNVTVPAGGEVKLEARMKKEGSRNFRDYVRQGYDLMNAGSTFHILEQTAEILNTGLISMTENDFGFDLNTKKTAVGLNPEAGHYQMVIMQNNG